MPSRETDLYNRIMELIRTDLNRERPSSLSELPTFQLVIEILRTASASLTQALPESHNDYYFSDSVHDEICMATETIALAQTTIREMFDSYDSMLDVLNIMSELITDVLTDIDDLLDDDRLPVTIDELINAYRN